MRFYGVFYELINTREIEITLPNNANFKTLLEAIDNKFNINISGRILDENGRIRRAGFAILLNGNAIREEDPDKVILSDNDAIAFLPAAVGGRKFSLCERV